VRNATLSWSAPSINGGSAITGYLVYRGTSAGSGELIATLGNVLAYRDEGLQNGTAYYYSVVAINDVGAGAHSVEVEATTFSAPTVPLNVIAVAGADNVTVWWEAPASDGGSVVRSYLVYRSAGGIETPITVAGTTLVDTDVVRGTTYSYRVVAVNAVGYGVSSPSTEGVAPGSVPSAPANLGATASIGQVELNWSAPTDDGGFTITGYNVYRAVGSGTLVKIATVTSPSYTDASGAQGTTYLYKVVAVNAKGEGAMASVSSASLWPSPAPAAVQVVREGSSAVVTWSIPSGNSSSVAVTGFAIYRGLPGHEVLIGYANSSDATSFIDADAPSEATSYYVVALNGIVPGGSSTSSPADLSARGLVFGEMLPLAVFGIIAAILLLFMVVGRKKKND
jgi:hypothetical protein